MRAVGKYMGVSLLLINRAIKDRNRKSVILNFDVSQKVNIDEIDFRLRRGIISDFVKG